MGRIFWQFFVAIWLTILSAISVIVVTNIYLKVLPPRGEMRDFKEGFSFRTASDMIQNGKTDEARAMLEALAAAPIPTRLSMKPVDVPAEACDSHARRFARIWDPESKTCFQLLMDDEPLTFFEIWAPHLMPPLAALLVSLVSAWLVARYLVRPVQTLRHALGALASGDFSIRIGPQFRFWRDEITALGKDFDAAAGKLQELEDSQKRLFHDVSHELRSPLSRMQAAFGLIKQNPAKLQGLMPRMEREIERLDGLVEEILTLARLGSGRTPIADKQPVDVIDLLSAVVEDAAFEAEPHGIAIDYQPRHTLMIAVDGELINRAIENVMRNAVKYSHDGSVIRVRTDVNAGRLLTIEISNVGNPVPPSEIERLFEPFSRYEESGNIGGHGLGLAIARRAIELHGGTVSAESNLPGGMIVTIHLPAG